LKQEVVGVHDSDFQQIQGGQQIGILDLATSGRRNSWLTGAIAGFYFNVNKFNLLASLNLLENMNLYEAVGERSRGPRWFCRNGKRCPSRA
jgi:hypothetical protein